MKRMMLASVLIPSGCGAKQDNSIYSSVVDPTSLETADNSVVLQEDPNWRRKQADACVHRQAYRQAASTDPAETVAKAVVEICMSATSESAILTANDEVSKGFFAMDRRDQRAEAIVSNYEPYSLSKVVERRAGKCRAY